MAWTKFPHSDDAYVYTPISVKKAWAQLHAGDAESFPKDAALVDAWIAFHADDFEKAMKLRLEQGMAGYSVANKATCIYATYLEKSDKKNASRWMQWNDSMSRWRRENWKSEVDPKYGLLRTFFS